MPGKIKLISTDFDGTLVRHDEHPMLDSDCMELIGRWQKEGVIWAMNTGRSVDLLESGLLDFEFPIHPDFILTSERDVFRAAENGKPRWEPFGDWNDRCAQAHAELFHSAQPVFDEVLSFVERKTGARLLYLGDRPEGLIAQSEAEMDRIVEFIEHAKDQHPHFHYQRNTVYLRFCHADYHKGAALGELSRLLEIARENIFAAGDHHNDVSMLDGRFAAMPACPENAITPVKNAVRAAKGYIAARPYGAGVHEALLHFSAKP
ncbi:MAG: HAD hydrolase family protein [Verrucomicrobiota bacterium]